MQFTQESSNMSSLLELGPDFPPLIFYVTISQTVMPTLPSDIKLDTKGWQIMAIILPLGSACCIIGSLLPPVSLITIFCPIHILVLGDINANRGRCFLCLSIVSFLIPIYVGAYYLKITTYKYSSQRDGCQG